MKKRTTILTNTGLLSMQSKYYRKYPTRSYFILADSYSQKIFEKDLMQRGYSYKNIPKLIEKNFKRNLKAAALFQDQIIFRASATFKSELTKKVVREAKVLIEEKILIPELRIEDDPLKNQLERNPQLFGNIRNNINEDIFLAELIDNALDNMMVDSQKLSLARSYLLIDHLYRQKLFAKNFDDPYLKPNVLWSDLEDIFCMLCNENPVDRSEFIDKVKNIYINPVKADLLIQNIYFGVGALFTKANPVWIDQLNPTIRLWEYPDIKTENLKGEGLNIAKNKRFKIIDRIEKNKSLNFQISGPIDPDKMANMIALNDLVLDNLNWNEIVALRKNKENIKTREAICKITPDNDSKEYAESWCKKLNDEFTKQVVKDKRRLSIDNKINLALGVLGIATMPLSSFSVLLSLFGLGVVAWNKSIEKSIPLILFSQLAREKTTDCKNYT